MGSGFLNDSMAVIKREISEVLVLS